MVRLRAHLLHASHYAPTIELAVRFARPVVADEWLFNRARVPVSTGGLMLASGEVWTADGLLVATGGSTLLCRPAARRPDGR